MKHIVTDMGGVIVDLYWELYASKMLGKEYTVPELQRLWITSNATKDFETGKLTFDEFANVFINEFKVSLSPEEIKKNFCAIVGPPKSGFPDLFKTLKRNFTISVLSNTNQPHADFLEKEYNLFSVFDNLFLSYKIGLMKPFPEVFEYVLDKLGSKGNDILFFDDSYINTDSAKRLGIKSFIVNSPQEIYDISMQYIES